MADRPRWLKRTATGRLEIGADRESTYALGHLIRTVEQAFLTLFARGQVSGTVHTCLGQELCGLGVVRALDDPKDVVFSTHRNHGHFLAYCGLVDELTAEIMGKEGGVCGGRGGSQHVSWGHFHSSGVQGGLTGIAVGAARAKKLDTDGAIVAAFIGDGTLGEGLLYESLNLASLWQVPLLFVVEHNRIAQTTDTAATTAGGIAARAQAFGLSTWQLTDRDDDYLAQAGAVVAEVRRTRRPGYLVVETARLGPHSKGDDLRSAKERDELLRRDPLARLGASLPESRRRAIEDANVGFVEAIVARNLERADATRVRLSCIIAPRATLPAPPPALAKVDGEKTVGETINEALRRLLESDRRVVLMGEDLHDPYGGAFKVTKGLSTAFPDSVISTPISEAGFVGAAIGLAMSGYRPIVEIMFADFLLLCLDQIYNHAVKIPWVYGESEIPLVIRTPGGGNRGYGPTHSQCLEHLLLAVPGLTVIAGSPRHDVGELLARAVNQWRQPTVFIEDKLLYAQPQRLEGYRALSPAPEDSAAALFPSLVAGAADDPALTLLAYGGSLPLVEAAAARLAQEEEISVEIVAPCLLAPLPEATLIRHLASRRRVLAVQETPAGVGFGSLVLSHLAKAGYRGQVAEVTAAPVPIPAARAAERRVLPQVSDVMAAARVLFAH